MRAPGDHKTNDPRAPQAARRTPLGPLRRTTSQEVASRPGDPTLASQPGPPPRQPKLLERLAEALRSYHYSPRIKQAYCHWGKRHIGFHRRGHDFRRRGDHL